MNLLICFIKHGTLIFNIHPVRYVNDPVCNVFLLHFIKQGKPLIISNDYCNSLVKYLLIFCLLAEGNDTHTRQF